MTTQRTDREIEMLDTEELELVQYADEALQELQEVRLDRDSLKADLEQALSLLEVHQWDGWWVGSNHPAPMMKEHLHCSTCDGHASDYIKGVPEGHAVTCELAGLLKKYGREVKFSD